MFLDLASGVDKGVFVGFSSFRAGVKRGALSGEGVFVS